MTGTAFVRWPCPIDQLEALGCDAARDLVVKCFFEAQRETFWRAKRKLQAGAAESDIETSVLASVRVAFREAGGDFDDPSPETLRRAVEVLARKARLWGTPSDIIDYHRDCMQRIFSRLRI
ncbi:hypothetical protein EG831_03860 [bacterium]|nr:hypothetical protein [bacterium]